MTKDKTSERYSDTLTVIVRNEGPMIHCGDSPEYRTVHIHLASDQLELIKLGPDEWISRCLLEPRVEGGRE